MRTRSAVRALCSRAGVATFAIGVALNANGAQRTFVSTGGSDAADCSRATPCREFNRALQATDSGGEVIALTSGAYEPFTIGKAVSISVPDGIHASIRSSSPTDVRNGVTVAAGAADDVYLRGLSIDTSPATNNGFGGSGISYDSGAYLFVENVSLTGTAVGYAKAGIVAEGSTPRRRMVVRNVVERGYLHGLAVGLLCCSVKPDSIEFVVEDSEFSDNVFAGIFLDIKGGSEAVIRGSVFANNGNGANGAGIWIERGDVTQPGGKVTIENNLVAHATSIGIFIGGGDNGEPTVTLAGNVIAFNPIGVHVIECPNLGGPCGGGTLAHTFGDNTVGGNGSNFSGPITPYIGL